MSRMVHEFSFPVEGPDGTVHTARARCDEDAAGHWQGWIEFLGRSGDEVLATDRETTQSSYEQLEYWATGLSAHYLRMALERARPVDEDGAEAPPLLGEPRPPPDEAPAPEEGRELEVRTLDPSLPRALMKTTDLPRGRVRRLKGGALLVYEGADAAEGEPTRHRFLVHARDRSAAVVAANWIWTRLRDQDAELWIEGRLVAVDPHALVTSLTDAD